MDKMKENLPRPTLLIVDDAPKNLQVLATILREKGYRLSIAPGGRQALDIVGRFRPDLILLDIVMPELDGFEVCRRLKDSPDTRDIPVIFLTAKTEADDIVRGFELGAVDYVTKPFNRAELLARINTHLKLKKAHEELLEMEQQNAALAMAVTANHEINQPLTVLQGSVELFMKSIDQGQLTDRQQKLLEDINRSVGRIEVILKRFTRSTSIHFQDYFGHQKMVVFDESNKQDP